MENTALITLLDSDDKIVVLPFRLPIKKANLLNTVSFAGNTYLRSDFKSTEDQVAFVQTATVFFLKEIADDSVRPLDLTDLTLVEILTEEDALIEGKEMFHAVGVIWKMLQRQKQRIFSVRYKEQPMLTLSVHDNMCHHIVGKCNRKPEAIELAIVSELLQPLGIVMGLNLLLPQSSGLITTSPSETTE